MIRLKSHKKMDFAERAFQTVALATGEIVPPSDRRNQAAVALGALGASKGGQARAKSLSPSRRSKIAKMAANSRWERT